jgi:hypothetical protein
MIMKKIAPYNPYGDESENRYHYVCRLLQQKVDPPSTAAKSIDCMGRVTYHSTLFRSVDCIDRTNALRLVPNRDLNEIAFNLDDYCSESVFKSEKSNAVRSAFLQAFIDNCLDESHEELKGRLGRAKDIALNQSHTLAISHTFFMKLFQVYWDCGELLFSQPEVLRFYIDPQKHLFPFGAELYFNESASL